jgi:hypothetical protein
MIKGKSAYMKFFYAPITLLGSAPYLLVVHPALPARSLEEFIACAGRDDSQTIARFTRRASDR